MSEELKSLVKQYNQAYEASKMLPVLKQKIIPVLKTQNMQKLKFNFGSHTIGYHSYTENDGLTQKLIKETLSKHYPQINPVEFMGRLLASRKQKTVETLRVTALSPTSKHE
jgi:hypothetical protein